MMILALLMFSSVLANDEQEASSYQEDSQVVAEDSDEWPSGKVPCLDLTEEFLPSAGNATELTEDRLRKLLFSEAKEKRLREKRLGEIPTVSEDTPPPNQANAPASARSNPAAQAPPLSPRKARPSEETSQVTPVCNSTADDAADLASKESSERPVRREVITTLKSGMLVMKQSISRKRKRPSSWQLQYLKREGETISFYKVKKNDKGCWTHEYKADPKPKETFNLSNAKLCMEKEKGKDKVHLRVDRLQKVKNIGKNKYDIRCLKPHYSQAARNSSKKLSSRRDIIDLMRLCTPLSKDSRLID